MPELTRRQVLKMGAAGAPAGGLSALGFDAAVAKATTVKRDLRIEGADVSHSMCPYCAVGCGLLAYTRKGRNGSVELLQIEGNPDSPVNEGTLCPKGASAMELAVSRRRLTNPLYRAPGADKWKRVSWNFVLDKLARNIKAARDRTFVAKDDEGNVARKCTLCYDRLQAGMEPACAKACPTDSIQFGPLDELRATAKKREADLHTQGIKEANLYGHDDKVYGGLNAFFLLMDKPEAYKLPNAANAVLPGRNNVGGYLGAFATAVLGVLGAVIARRQRNKEAAAETAEREQA